MPISSTAQTVSTLERVYGRQNLSIADRITGAEDFAFYQEEVPGFIFFIGGRPADVAEENAVPNHSPFFTVDESALLPGVKVMANVAFDYLTDNAP